MPVLLASIPSPSRNTVDIGVELHVYGLMIALGVLAAVWLGRRRWAAWGYDPELIVDLAYWGVPGGLIGARLYHVITDFNRLYADNLVGIVKVWDGGLGIPGGIAGGVFAGWLCARRHRAPIPDLFDMVAPALPLAQAIGRIGNYFNQELFGRPTSLPWGLEIDTVHRPVEVFGYATFHPTFLYELLWNLTLVGVLLAIDSRRGTGQSLPRWVPLAAVGFFALGGGMDLLMVVQRQASPTTVAQIGLFLVGAVLLGVAFRFASGLSVRGLRRRGDLFAVYITGYFVGRLWIESLRIDTANTIAGLRLNEWTAIIVIAAGFGALWWRGRADELPPIDPASGSIFIGVADLPDPATDS